MTRRKAATNQRCTKFARVCKDFRQKATDLRDRVKALDESNKRLLDRAVTAEREEARLLLSRLVWVVLNGNDLIMGVFTDSPAARNFVKNVGQGRWGETWQIRGIRLDQVESWVMKGR